LNSLIAGAFFARSIQRRHAGTQSAQEIAECIARQRIFEAMEDLSIYRRFS